MVARSVNDINVQVVPDVPGDVLLPEGLVGCSDWQRFQIERQPDIEQVYVMQSQDDADVAFLIAPLLAVAPAYFAYLHRDDVAALEGFAVGQSDDIVLFCTLNARGADDITANLLGPLVVDIRTRVGHQVVMSQSPWSARHRLGDAAPDDRR